MASLIQVGDVVRFTNNGAANADQAILNVWDYVIDVYAGAGTINDVTALSAWGNIFVDNQIAPYLGRIASDYNLNSTQTRLLNNTVAVSGRRVWQYLYNVFSIPTAPIVGGGTVADDYFAAATVRLQTGIQGRAARGSKRIGPIPNDKYSLNQLDATYRNNLKADIATGNAAFVTAVGASLVAPVTMHLAVAPASLNAATARPTLFTLPVSSFYVNRVVGSQISRKGKERFA